MSCNYTSIRPRLDRVYSVEQVVSLYGICRNTLGNWIASGLLPSDANQPRIFRGAELARFHQERAGIKTPLRRGQFKCMSCKARVFPDLSTLRFLDAKTGTAQALATCPDCGGGISKLLNETNRDAFENSLKSNTSLVALDEGNADTQAGIVQSAPILPPPNDRLILEWQNWAARYDEKTVAAHLRAIR